MQWLACWTSDLQVSGLRPALGRRVVSQTRNFTTHCLSPPWWDTSDKMLGVTLRWTDIPSQGSGSNVLFAPCYGNRVKLQPSRPPVRFASCAVLPSILPVARFSQRGN